MNDEFLNQLAGEKSNMILPRTDTLSSQAALRILQLLQQNVSLDSTDQAKAVIAVMFQQGGTARGCDGNMTITLFGKEIKLAEVRKTLKSAGFNRGERKLARTLSSDIQKICYHLEIPGNLYQKIVRNNPELEFSMEEQSWLSDFQSTNRDTPSRLRNLITQSFNKKPLPVLNKQIKTGK